MSGPSVLKGTMQTTVTAVITTHAVDLVRWNQCNQANAKANVNLINQNNEVRAENKRFASQFYVVRFTYVKPQLAPLAHKAEEFLRFSETDRQMLKVMNTLRGIKTMSSSIYHSLESVLRTLTASEVRQYPEVEKLLKICAIEGLLDEVDGKYLPGSKAITHKDYSVPFIVIEGLDGSGKTSLSSIVRERYQMNAMQTPPGKISEFRDFFDNQPEPIRRAFYSLGNYLAAENVLKCTDSVIMDRFWHSTAAYAIGNDRKSIATEDVAPVNLSWPSDLLQPNLVLFLFVSETERVRRHTTRDLQTNTQEEQTLAKDQVFRNQIVDIYRRIEGPHFIEINADNSMDDVQKCIFKIIEDTFPALCHRVR